MTDLPPQTLWDGRLACRPDRFGRVVGRGIIIAKRGEATARLKLVDSQPAIGDHGIVDIDL